MSQEKLRRSISLTKLTSLCFHQVSVSGYTFYNSRLILNTEVLS